MSLHRFRLLLAAALVAVLGTCLALTRPPQPDLLTGMGLVALLAFLVEWVRGFRAGRPSDASLQD